MNSELLLSECNICDEVHSLLQGGTLPGSTFSRIPSQVNYCFWTIEESLLKKKLYYFIFLFLFKDSLDNHFDQNCYLTSHEDLFEGNNQKVGEFKSSLKDGRSFDSEDDNQNVVRRGFNWLFILWYHNS